MISSPEVIDRLGTEEGYRRHAQREFDGRGEESLECWKPREHEPGFGVVERLGDTFKAVFPVAFQPTLPRLTLLRVVRVPEVSVNLSRESVAGRFAGMVEKLWDPCLYRIVGEVGEHHGVAIDEPIEHPSAARPGEDVGRRLQEGIREERADKRGDTAGCEEPVPNSVVVVGTRVLAEPEYQVVAGPLLLDIDKECELTGEDGASLSSGMSGVLNDRRESRADFDEEGWRHRVQVLTEERALCQPVAGENAGGPADGQRMPGLAGLRSVIAVDERPQSGSDFVGP